MGFFEKITSADLQVLEWIRENLWCGFLDAVMPVITFLGNAGWFWIAMAVVMLFFGKTRKTGLMMGAALIFGLVLCNLILKPTVARIRPYELVEGVKLLIGEQSDFSFPSGHTAASFEAATVLMIRDKKFGIPALVLASVIAFSRMYLYVHYPTDILGGIAVGVLCGVLGYFVVGYLWKRFAEKKA
ncbi:MAG: phosphatase PAP2 family protein [Ruminococcaceae bacterium]|nr:phosphatase PAP2 family protein [Oscillospiraceae bacterium]